MNLIRSSVIIVGYNCLADLQRGLPSVSSSLGSDDEIILVDNASQDGGPEWVETTLPRIRVIRAGKNLGYGGGNNLGAHAARGEFVVFLNPDTTVQTTWLDALISVLIAKKGAVLVTSKILLMQEPHKINTCGNDVHLSGITMCRGLGQPESEYQHGDEVAAVSGAAFAMRRDEFLRLGGFDGDFFMYMEDTDLSLRARLTGSRILLVPDSIVYHAYQLRFGPRKVLFQECNRYRMLFKVLRVPTLVVLLPILLCGELVTWSFVLLRDRGQLKNKFSAYALTIANMKTILEKRREVQNTRKITDRELLSGSGKRLDFGQADAGGLARTADLILNPIFEILGWFVMVFLWW